MNTFRSTTKCRNSLAPHIGPARRAYTMVEVVVAMAVLGITVSGLFPLLTILSRDLQPIRKFARDGSASYDCRTPARDGNAANFPVDNPVFYPHTWYFTPANDTSNPPDPAVGAWVRKLGAGASLSTTPSGAVE